MILWAHGLEGSPEGMKVQALRRAGFDVTAPDGRFKVLADRLYMLDAESRRLAEQRPLLAGSSYGGLAVAWLAAQHPERFRGLLLLAPALHHREPPATDPLAAPPGLPTVIIHGRLDDVVPVAESRAYAARSPGADLRIVDDGHVLGDSVDAIIAAARQLRG